MTDETKIAINETKESSKRARQIILLIQVASIAVFVALWQERQEGWAVTRLRSAQAAAILAECQFNTKNQQGCRIHLSDIPPADLQRGAALLLRWHFTPEQAKNWSNWMQQNLVFRVMNTGVPGLGATLDVNDLSLLGGITFLTLLAWLRFALWRERSNIHFVFGRCKRSEVSDELVDAYELLAMAQVLSVPKMPYDEGGRPTSSLPLILLWSPVGVHLSVLLYDRSTLSLGADMQRLLTNVEFLIASVIFGAIVWLAWSCTSYSRMIGAEWHAALDHIRNSCHHRRSAME